MTVGCTGVAVMVYCVELRVVLLRITVFQIRIICHFQTNLAKFHLPRCYFPVH